MGGGRDLGSGALVRRRHAHLTSRVREPCAGGAECSAGRRSPRGNETERTGLAWTSTDSSGDSDRRTTRFQSQDQKFEAQFESCARAPITVRIQNSVRSEGYFPIPGQQLQEKGPRRKMKSLMT